jgi:DNA recombination protein RmuC
MQELIGAIIAAFAGIVLGFWMRAASNKAEKAQLERRASELTEELVAARAEVTRLHAESATRAGFESLAAEREKTIVQLATERDSLRADLHARGAVESAQNARVKELETELRNERQNLSEKLALLESAKQALANQFEALAGKILDEKSKSFSEGSQKELGTLLTPLKTQIEDFRKKVEEAQTDSKSGVVELRTLVGTLGSLNKALTEEAHNLATALRRDTKAQGNWGETILRNILEKSGLQEGAHYSFQQSFAQLNDDDGSVQRRQTDVLIKLPGGRHLIIDSKVSLNAYNDSVNAEDEKVRTDALKRHLLSLRNHFGELAGRNYHTLPGVQSPDFVVMFVPIEPAFLLALQNDEGLWHEAYSKGVLLTGPTTVLFVIRIVKDLWNQQRQADNVEKVMKRGAELYDKFVGFVSNLETVGNSLHGAKNAYDEACRQLSTGPGNLVRQVEMLRKLGVAPKTRKQIPIRLLEEAESDADEPMLELAVESEDSSDSPA